MQTTGLTWSNARSNRWCRNLKMTAIRSMVSRIVRVLLAALLIAGAMGKISIAGEKYERMSDAHHALAIAPHDCCDSEPALPDEDCALLCAQMPCGPTALPVQDGETRSADPRTIRWAHVASSVSGIAPETGTPPPRA